MDDVVFAYKPRLLDVAAQLKPSRTRSLGLGYKLCAAIPVAGQRTHGTTFRTLKVTSRVATPGAVSAVYDWLVEVAARIQYIRERCEEVAHGLRRAGADRSVDLAQVLVDFEEQLHRDAAVAFRR